MNEFRNGFSATPDGFSAVSMQEPDPVEGVGIGSDLKWGLIAAAKIVGEVIHAIWNPVKPTT